MPWPFRTVPDELLDCAETFADHYRKHGYAVQVEKSELGFPNTPTLQAKRANTTVVVEVTDRIDREELRRWTAFGKSSGHDFRVIIGLDESFALSPEHEDFIRKLGVGCIVASDTGFIERIAASDLALNVQLPPLEDMPAKVRKLLGPAYEKFTKSDWREGFAEACQAFEAETRRYLKRHSKTGRVQVMRRGRPTRLTSREIDKFTMGQLAQQFNNIITRNLDDSNIGDALASVNQDRIGVTHKKTNKTVERRLRRNVGRHMWTLYNGFKAVIK